jgi:O-antigen/teichoic acid export membrane protein
VWDGSTDLVDAGESIDEMSLRSLEEERKDLHPPDSGSMGRVRRLKHCLKTRETSPRGIYRHFMSDSLYRNSTYLLANLVVTAITGFLFVLICTRFFPQKELGYATALMGALWLATAAANIGMNRTIVRFLGKSKTKSQDFVTEMLLVGVCALVAGIILSFFFQSYGLKDTNFITAVIFVAAVVATSISVIMGSAFIASRASGGTLAANCLFSVTRLGFPLLALVVIGSGYMGIFSAQLAGAVVAVIASLWLLKNRHGFNFKTKPSIAVMRGKWRFAFGSYTCDLIGGLPSSVLPIIVVARLGPIAGALWYAAIQIITFLLNISSMINQAMFAELVHQTNSIRTIVKKAATGMFGLLVPLCAVIIIGAPWILKIFGPNYVAAEHVLRLMTLFCLVEVADYIGGSILALYKRVFYMTFANVVNAVVVVVYCLTWAHNLNGIAVGWIFGEIANFVLIVGGGLYISRRNVGKLVLEDA